MSRGSNDSEGSRRGCLGADCLSLASAVVRATCLSVLFLSRSDGSRRGFLGADCFVGEDTGDKDVSITLPPLVAMGFSQFGTPFTKPSSFLGLPSVLASDTVAVVNDACRLLGFRNSPLILECCLECKVSFLVRFNMISLLCALRCYGLRGSADRFEPKQCALTLVSIESREAKADS